MYPGFVSDGGSLASYEGLAGRFVHEAIDHTIQYVRGEVHTNGLENFWSLFKRMLDGTYTHCAPFHLQRYADEEVFRFVKRKTNDAGRFNLAMSNVAGRRLTWRELCGVGGAGFMGLE